MDPIYESRLKAQRDLQMHLDDAHEKDHQEGWNAGYLAAQKLAMVERVQFLQHLLRQPTTPAEELEATPSSVLSELCEGMKYQLFRHA